MTASFKLRGYLPNQDALADTRAVALKGRESDVPSPEGIRESLGIKWEGRQVLQPLGSRAVVADAQVKAVEVQSDDILEVTFDDGFGLFIRGDDFHEEFLVSATQSRAAATRVDDGTDETWTLPQSFRQGRISREGVGHGVDNSAIRQVGVCRIELLKEVQDQLIGVAAEAVAKKLARILCERYEKATLNLADTDEKPAGWLHRCSLTGSFQLGERVTANQLDAEKPILLWIHGTASSTQGSFGNLWKGGNRSSNLSPLSPLSRVYEQSCAFQHRTLTVSPVANAIALAEALPEGARLHIVSHSRGGLVGELLCRAERVLEEGTSAADPFDDDDARLFTLEFQKTGADDETLKIEWTHLKELGALLKRKKFKIERFVRVACPALGTTLASRRLDRWLSFLLWALRQVATGNPFVEAAITFLTEFAKALLKERTNPAALPGLEAMMPGSALVRMLNRPNVVVQSDLSVIAGDLEGDWWLERVKYFLVDQFYGGAHDLIVNTGSMFGGAERKAVTDGAAQARRHGATFWCDRGPLVSHFSYFFNPSTVSRLTERLLMNTPKDAKFRPINARMIEEPARGAAVKWLGSNANANGPETDTVTGLRPVVFVLPGIMGSQLAVDGQRIWVDLGRLALGGLTKLNIEAAGVAAPDVLPDAYADLCEYLRKTHDVIRFPYDWRQSLTELGKRLAARVRPLLAEAQKAGQPVRFVAHSMGGLVLASLIRQAPDVWEQIRREPNSRTVLLGTPLAGSYSIVQLLLGQESLVRKLALLDVKSGHGDLMKVISKFPGVLELLPFDVAQQGGSVFDFEYWQELQSDLPKLQSWPLPEAASLQAAKNVLNDLAQVTWAKDSVVYIAGQADQTPVSVRVVRDGFGKNGVLEVTMSPRGDGRVLWDLPAIQGLPRWFMDCEHGALASHESGFKGILELLRSGTTNELRATEPAVERSRGEELEVIRPADEFEAMLPTREALSFAALGVKRMRGKAASQAAPIKVSITHGDLCFARHPVAVGHYQGDTIIGPESKLDEALDGWLSRRQGLGIYPGPLETCEIFIDQDDGRKPGGAIIVGLGRVGELTPRALERTFGRAVLGYAIEVAEHPGQRFDGEQDGLRRVRLSTLLIGTGADSLTIRDSMESILRGVRQAADRLKNILSQDPRGRAVQIAEVEFLELYEDRAIDAAACLQEIAASDLFRQSFEIVPGLKSRDGSLKRIRYFDAPGWWHRLRITREVDDSLRFLALTRRARAEVRLLPTQQALVQKFVEQAIGSTVTRPEVAQTLFEVLLPNALKEQAPRAGHLALVLDDTAAALPWELLTDRTDAEGPPLAVALGFLRQLETADFREAPNNALLKRACVIGDPLSEFVPLSGAEDEAREVARALSDCGFAVESQIKTTAFEIVTALHRSEYRILHLSGHGVHEFPVPPGPRMRTIVSQQAGSPSPDQKLVCLCPINADCPLHGHPRIVSGMVLGNGQFLTPADVEQMRVVPELVFINCCHLGKVADTSKQDTPRTDRHRFAANLAAQFIRMGVKAVIAAGWAVDDQAARTFAVTFYQELLKGAAFGEAVLRARGATWERHRHLNTWGAYQCYGDPGWRPFPRDDGTQSSSTNKPPRWTAPAEAAAELATITRKASTLTPGKLPSLKEWLRCVRDAIPSGWQTEGEIQGELALALMELGEFQEALQVLERAIKLDAIQLPPALLERLCDCRYRVAFQLGQNRAGDARRLLKDSLATITGLCRIAPTRERFKSAASTYKRQFALGQTWEERQLSLQKMTCNYLLVEHFGRVASHSEAKSNSDESFGKLRNAIYGRYTGLALLSLFQGSLVTDVKSICQSVFEDFKGTDLHQRCLDAFRSSNSGQSDRRPLFDLREASAWCVETELLARRDDDDDPRFWNATWLGQCPLLRLLLRYVPSKPSGAGLKLPTDGERHTLCAEIANGYARALERGSSPRNQDSVFQHLSFVSCVLLDPELPIGCFSKGARRMNPKQRRDLETKYQNYRNRLCELGLAIQRVTEELRRRIRAD